MDATRKRSSKDNSQSDDTNIVNASDTESLNKPTTSGSDSSHATPVKKPKRLQKFIHNYTERWPVLKPSKSGPNYAYCTVCEHSFSVAHGGANDCAAHVEGSRHRKYAAVKASNQNITAFFVQPQQQLNDFEHSVTSAELLFTNFIIEHNISVASSDHTSKLFSSMFGDSKIAAKYQCSRTKTSALIRHLANKESNSVAEIMMSNPFSLATDGSNDSHDKFFPVLIRHVGSDGLIQSSLLSVPTVEHNKSATGENIYELMNTELTSRNIPWKNCIAFASDNASVMTGNNKGTIAFIHKQEPNVYLSGCPCHLIHLAAKKASANLPVNVEEILVDIYYYLQHSSKRQGELIAIQALYSKEHYKVLKHVSTRWLSLQSCVDRLLLLWRPLRDFFDKEAADNKAKDARAKGESQPADRRQRVVTFLHSHTTRLYCMFLSYALAIFNKANLSLQSEDPLIHKSRRICLDLYRNTLVKFLKPSAFTGKFVTEIDLKVACFYKPASEIMIGEKAREFISDRKIDAAKVEKLCKNAKNFYITASQYMKEKLHMSDELLTHVEVMDPQLIKQKKFNSVRFFLTRYPTLMPEGTSMDQVQDEFCNLQIESDESLSGIMAENRVDKQWNMIAELKDASGCSKYRNLCSIAKAVLLIPHSNAGCERVFSHVRKIRTDFRASMSKETLESFCILKMRGGVCYGHKYSKEETREAKCATAKSLKQ